METSQGIGKIKTTGVKSTIAGRSRNQYRGEVRLLEKVTQHPFRKVGEVTPRIGYSIVWATKYSTIIHN